ARRRRRARIQGGVGSRTRPRVQFEDGRLRLGTRRTDHRHWIPGGAVRALLHVARRSRPTLLLVPVVIHGRDAWYRALGQPGPVGLLLGIDQPVFLPVDRLLAPETAGAGWRPDGADRHVDGRTVPVRRRAGARAY